MRTFILLLCTTVFSFNTNNSFSQERIVIDEDKLVSVDEVFNIIQKQTKYHFLYPQDMFTNTPKVKLQKGIIFVSQLLEKSFSHSNVRFKLSKNNVIVIDKNTSQNSLQQQISGIITTAGGLPLPGTSIIVKGTLNGTQSDFDGKFSIAANPGDILVISYLGYTTQEIPAIASNMNIILFESTNKLQEVVVTGYTTREKKKLTSAIATVEAKLIENVPMANFDQILQGQAPGLLVQAGSGNPGSSANIVLRGVKASFNTQDVSPPLFLIDGAEVSDDDFSAINPNDIESVSILKDAAATAIYGSRGARGVIVVTTKRGKKGKTTFEYTSQNGFSAKPDISDSPVRPLTSSQLIDLQHKLGIGSTVGLSTRELDSLKQINTNWLDVLTRSGTLQSHEIKMSGGNEKTDFYVSAGYFNQKGVVISKGALERFSTRLNLNHEVGNLKMGINLYLANTVNTLNFDFGRKSTGNPFWGSILLNPYDQPFNPSTGEFARPLRSQNSSAPNPLERLATNVHKRLNDKVLTTFNFNYKVPFLEGLSIRSRWSFDYGNFKSRRINPPNSFAGEDGRSSISEEVIRSINYVGTNSIHYDFTIADKHVFNVAAYQEYIERRSEATEARGRNLEQFTSLEGVTSDFRVGSDEDEDVLTSLFATLDYSYDNKYFLSLSGRRDGSANFGPNNRFGKFYSAGLGWVLTEEKFMENVSFIDFAKLRLSYGTTGNSSADPRNSRQIFTRTDGYGLQNGLQARAFNTDLKWETTEKLDIGLDFTLFENFLTLGADYYNERTIDFLLNQPLSLTNGIGEQRRNSGSLRNRGVELSLEVNPIRKGDFTWNTSFNFATNTGKVLTLPGGLPILKNPFLFEEGKESGRYYFVKSAGINPANGNRLYYTPDGELTEVYDPENGRQSLGRRSPKYYGGFSNTFAYKGLSLSVLVTYATGHVIRNSQSIEYLDATNVSSSNVSTDALRYWKQPGDITDIPRLGGDFERFSSNVLEDASYAKIRNASLSYNFTNAVLDKLNMSGLRLSLQGQNLFTFTKFTGTDPENSLTEYQGNYPGLRTYTLGLTAKF